jgi:Ca2+-transporting ATPase
VAECQSAGIRLKLLTGDHPLTAHAIADAAGLLHDHDDGIVTGEELDALAADARAERIARASLFARIRPEQKHAIVEALQRAGETVAMTGDGINDAPALRRADLGVSLGRRGTEVARAAAQLVLLRDDFAALVAAVREGRHLFGNIQRAFLYVIAFHAPIVGLALVAPLLGLPILLLPVHLVWLELIVHPVSVLAFEGEPAPGDVMRRPPRDPRAPLLPRGALARSMLSGLLLGGAALGFYVVRLPAGVEAARGAALAVLVLGSLLLVRAEQALDRAWWRVPAPRARTVLVGLLVAASLVVGVQLPACARLLHVAPLPSSDWLLAAALAAAAVGWRALGRREE